MRPTPRTLIAVAVVVLAACVTPPPVVTPPAPTVHVVTATTAPAVAGCLYGLSTNVAPPTLSQAWAGVPVPGGTGATFAYTGGLPFGVTVTAACPGYLPASTAFVLTAANVAALVALPITPAAPPVPPLPAPPTRQQLATARACFQGLTVTTAQLGSVPSFGGVETGMLTAAADRQATYAAIRAAGCNEIVLDVYCHYTEAGVAYPNATACSNDWTTDNNATLVARVAEAVDAGLDVLLMQGGDELAFSTVASQVPGQMLALQAYAGGDLTRFVVLCPGFDSIVPIANAPPADTSVQTLVSLLAADRAAIGPAGVLALELPTGWAFWGPDTYSGTGSYTTPPGQDLDVLLQEFANVSPGSTPTPTIVSGTWDPTHADYAPTFSAGADPWMQIWQVAARTVNHYVAPPDEITAATCASGHGPQVPVTGNGATTACVYADDNPQPYTGGGTPRGPFVVVAFEIGTYQWTHGQTTAAAVGQACAYVAGMGYDATACPTTATPASRATDRILRWEPRTLPRPRMRHGRPSLDSRRRPAA